MKSLTAAAALLLLAGAAHAQEDACSQSAPCTWVLEVDADGFVDAAEGEERTVTVGDWYVLDAFNYDDVDHTVTLEDHGVALTVPAVDGAVSEPFQLDAVGSYGLVDDPSGDYLTVTVVATDTVADEFGDDEDAGDEDADNGAPLSLPVALGAVLLAALAVRRR